MKPKIAYLVSHDYDDLIKRAEVFLNEYSVLKEQFALLGYELEKVDWQRPEINWKQYACVIPKAVWNYYNEVPQFKAFLQTIKSAQVPMQNPVDSVMWNMDKKYLLDLEARGFSILPMKIYSQGSVPNESWFSIFENQGVLAKPTISGGSKNTIQFPASEWRQHLSVLNTVLLEGDLIIQPFAKEVQTEGEYSYFFYGGKFAHAILKVPSSGDFRAHSFFGARQGPYDPLPEEIENAAHFLKGAPTPCAYARVDMIRIKNVLTLVELEIIEPYLYMEYAINVIPAQLFAEAVVKSLKN